MAIVAAPNYLPRDEMRHASPGLRFGIYLPLWDRNSAPAQEPRWTIADNESKEALDYVCKLSDGDRQLMDALIIRQAAQVSAVNSVSPMLVLDARTIAPFATGLGNEHPLGNGFAFLNPYGLPYLPASGVKGVLRSAARELANGQWGDTCGWTTEAIEVLFGKAGEGAENEHEDANLDQQGALDFWDVIPKLNSNTLLVEVLTPHQKHYYDDGEAPHESGNPSPIYFLTVPPDSEFTFYVLCDLFFLQQFDTGLGVKLARENGWQDLLQSAFEHAFDWCGFGAKTSVGYGAMAVDEKATKNRKAEATAMQAKRGEEAQFAAATANLPEDAVWVEGKLLSGLWEGNNNALIDDLCEFLNGREMLSPEALIRLKTVLDDTWPGILKNPDAVKGKRQRPKFRDGPKRLASLLLSMNNE